MVSKHAQPGAAIEVRGLEKRYGDFSALRGVDFVLQSGEIHAIMGQNGAGKSTLIRILAGAETPSAGTLKVFGRDLAFSSPAAAAAAGISVVYQDLSLVPAMTVTDNIFLGKEPCGLGGAVRTRHMRRQVRDLIDAYHLPLDPAATVESLPFAFKQMTEIAKALLSEAKILILDEPTSALTDGEKGILFAAVRSVVSRGVSVIYVTHRMNEVFELCDRITVFRDGRNEGTSATRDTDMKALVASIVGPQGSRAAPVRDATVPGRPASAARAAGRPPAVELRGVGNAKLQAVDLCVDEGEIVGLAGALGSGRTEILETLFGLRPVVAGEIVVAGKRRTFRAPTEAIAAGIGMVPEDRHEEGLVLAHSIERNLALPSLKSLTRFGFFRRRDSRARAATIVSELSVKARSPDTVLSALSGGNQQKVVFGKWSHPRCRLLLLDEPTIGVDVGARAEIYSEIRKAVDQGSAVLVVSSDLAELMSICDRFYIVQNGTVTAAVARDALSSEEDLHHLVHTPSAEERH